MKFTTDKTGAYTPKDLIQMVLMSGVAGMLSALSDLFTFGMTLSVMTLSLFALMSFITTLICFKKPNLAKQGITFTLYCSVVFVSYAVWLGGGLHDVGMVALPAIVLLMALLGSSLHTFILYIILVSVVFYVGVSTVNGTNPHVVYKMQYTNILSFIIIFLFSTYFAYLFSKGYQKILGRLSEENIKFQQSQLKLKQLAHFDELTGLFNRSAVAEKYKVLLNSQALGERSIYLYFMDLDDFKEINDTYNHSVGDELLIEIAKRIKSLSQGDDVVSRLSGDEFLLVAIRPNDFDSGQYAVEIREAVTQPFTLYGIEIDITASIGIAVVPKDGKNFEDVRKKADIAMYKAKKRGKNGFEHYNQHLHAEVVRNNAIMEGLQHCLSNDSFELYFQPKVDIATGNIESAEALIRWVKNNPYGSQPDEFIPIVESTDLVADIGEWVIEEACLICKQWHEQGFDYMKIAVNVSVSQLSRNNLKSIIEQALAKADLAPEYLEVELTEHTLLNHSRNTVKQLEEIKALGVELSIDDFGTGYSNLSYLTQFKVDTLKLDKSFTLDIDSSSDSLAIVKAVISMSNILGLKVVAEGVETDKAWKILQSLGCDFGQGYLWGKPMPNDRFIKQLAAA